MPSAWDPAVRADLTARVRLLTPAHAARWGKFSPAGMLAHLNESTRMGLGELRVTSKAPSFLRWPPVRYLFVHVLPMPRSAPTAPELLARSGAADVEQEQRRFEELMARLATAATLAAEHPAFGPMSRKDWGVLMHKHVDHHLRQFGC